MVADTRPVFGAVSLPISRSPAISVVAQPAVQQVAALGVADQVVDDDGLVAAVVVGAADHEANRAAVP